MEVCQQPTQQARSTRGFLMENRFRPVRFQRHFRHVPPKRTVIIIRGINPGVFQGSGTALIGQVVDNINSHAVAVVGNALHGAGNDVARPFRLAHKRGGDGRLYFAAQIFAGGSDKGRMSTQAGVQQRAQRVDVGARVDWLARHLFRGRENGHGFAL